MPVFLNLKNHVIAFKGLYLEKENKVLRATHLLVYMWKYSVRCSFVPPELIEEIQ